MSYRTIKRLLGETNLEQKCRFLFGGGLMLRITASFYFYARLNASLVYEQNHTTARLLTAPVMLANHSKYIRGESSGTANQSEAEIVREEIEKMTVSLKPDDLPQYSWKIVPADFTQADAKVRPFDDESYDAIEKLRTEEINEVIEIVDDNEEKGEYHYYGALRAKTSCVNCHNNPQRFPNRTKEVREGDLLGMAKITFPLDKTNRALAWNNAILLATAIATAFLAMIAAYAIVRYVIVKPVLHLKHVSDEISRGNLDLRASINTGDEFEELSHAFNRMLRHLMTVQDEMRTMNQNLDVKLDELAHSNLQLYEANKLKDEFLATMSHELRTPLNSILGFSDVLATARNLDERQTRYLKNIQNSGKDLMALINDLLDLAKIESGKIEIQPAEFSAADFIERQVDSLMPLSEKKRIQLTWEVDQQLPVLYQDSGKLQQIINNLLSNAIKFTPEAGQVQVRANRVEKDWVCLEVEDNGIGIPLEDQHTIFEKFRQGKTVPGQEGTLTREYGGTGLGLSIVKELCKLLGGEISLESEFGKGSTFRVRIPIRLDKQTLRTAEQLSNSLMSSDFELQTPPGLLSPDDDPDESAA